MRQVHVACAVALTLLLCVTDLLAQSVDPSASVPRLINLSGTFRPAEGQAPAPLETVTLALYGEEVGGAPLWEETQTIPIARDGQYSILLGQTQPDGIPFQVFAAGDARWLGMTWARPGEVEGPRTRLTSVPYALRAADADTLGGRPASAFLLAPTAPDGSVRTAGTNVSPNGSPQLAVSNVVLAGTPNFLAKYVNSADVANSAVFENGGVVGIGTTTPLDMLHVQFTNTAGTMTGLAVQNLGNTGAAYSGMLFYDQNGALGQFQGFGNLTHEYRINNIAKNGANYDGTINFMIGSTSRLFVSSAGNVGIGTTTPFLPGTVASGVLSVANSTAGQNTIFTRKSFSDTAINAALMARVDPGFDGPAIMATVGYDDTYTFSTDSAVFGANNRASSVGVYGYSNGGFAGLVGQGVNGAPAGAFFGNVTVSGNLSVSGSLTKGSGTFKIDHPLDPANQYLSHSFVESPDMKDLYDGVVVLDASGEAWVQLPDWFEALNTDFRYQLTAIGAPGPNLYIATEIAGHRFRIAGGTPSAKVSWLVTGVRHDPFAQAHPTPVEEMKSPQERGKYLFPEVYGQPPEAGVSQPPSVVVKPKGSQQL